MASSTTIAIARSKADKTSRLIEKPKTQRKKKVPIKATGTAIIGIRVERISCRKIYTTINTNTNVINNVIITSSIEAKRNSVVSCSIVYFIPGGKLLLASSKADFTASAISVALEPAIWLTIPITAGCPLLISFTLYINAPSSTLATSFNRNVSPVKELFNMMFSNSVVDFKRPRYLKAYS